MLKKLLIVSAIGVAACFALKGTRMFGYAKDEVSAIGDWVESKVPVEKKIKQLRKEIGTLDKEIEKCSNELAREIVEVDYLTNDISRETAALAMEEKKVVSAGDAIRSATERVAYGRFNVPVDEAKQMLADDVKRLVTRKETLATMQDTLVAREKIKESLLKSVESIKRQKRELSVAVDRLEADAKRLQLQQIESKYQFDDTQLASVKQSLTNLQKEIDVKRAKLKLAPTVVSEPGAPANNLSVDDILSPLNGSTKKKDSN